MRANRLKISGQHLLSSFKLVAMLKKKEIVRDYLTIKQVCGSGKDVAPFWAGENRRTLERCSTVNRCGMMAAKVKQPPSHGKLW